MKKLKIMFVSVVSCIALLLSVEATQVFGQAAMARVPEGQKAKVLGIINSRDGEKLVMTTLDQRFEGVEQDAMVVYEYDPSMQHKFYRVIILPDLSSCVLVVFLWLTLRSDHPPHSCESNAA